jgi:hypothetical protein
MRGLYAHASNRMRDELKAALLCARWEESLREQPSDPAASGATVHELPGGKAGRR